MNKQEAAKLLSLIKLSYPTAYRDIDRETANATVNMWQMSFSDVPYQLMEQAFNQFRMVSKFPPTVAEMVEELKNIHFQATEGALLMKCMGDRDMMDRYLWVMTQTKRFTHPENLGSLNVERFPRLNGGESDVQRLGASRGELCDQNRLP